MKINFNVNFEFFQNQIYKMKPNKKMLETRTNLFSTFRKNLFRRKPNSKSQEPVLLSVKATNSEFTEEENFNKTCQIERYEKCSKECRS